MGILEIDAILGANLMLNFNFLPSVNLGRLLGNTFGNSYIIGVSFMFETVSIDFEPYAPNTPYAIYSASS